MANLPQIRTSVAAGTLAMSLLGILAQPASGQMHKMQIEQVIGGVNGDTNAQAIQLRMRDDDQNNLDGLKMVVYDQDGNNPIDLANLAEVDGDILGDHVLIATDAFINSFNPPLTRDFPMIPIPANYLAAGSLTYGAGAFVFWRLSWGNYMGPNGGNADNDNDNPDDFGPPWPGSLPSMAAQALRFDGPANAQSISNELDYVLDCSSVWTNNQQNPGEGATLFHPCPGNLNGDCVVGAADLLALLVAWGPGPDPADLDCDGTVGASDLLSLLVNWGRCDCGTIDPLTLEEELADACLTQADWDAFVAVMTDPNSSQADKDRYLCWMEHYLYDCNKCFCIGASGCPGPDPFD